MGSLFRGLMVLVSFVLFLALFGAVTVAAVALGPVVWGGVRPEDLPTLLPTGGGTPTPFVIAAGVGLAATLFIGMIAMLISEGARSVLGFTGSLVKTALWFAVLFGGGLAFYLHGLPGEGNEKYLPAMLMAGGLIAAAIVSGILLGLPFLWWVSERPRHARLRREDARTPAPNATPAVVVEPIMPTTTAPAPQLGVEASAPAPVPGYPIEPSTSR